MISKSILATFIALIINTLLIAISMFLMADMGWGPELPVLLWILSFIFGGILTFITRKNVETGKMSKFLLLTGLSAVGFPVFVVGHNVFYAFAELSNDIGIVRGIFTILEGACFFIAIFLCPIGLLVGAIGTSILIIKDRKSARQ